MNAATMAAPKPDPRPGRAELAGPRPATVTDCSARRVFAVITDIGRLPAWNAAIEAVVERPTALAEGAEWIVTMHPPRAPSWQSVSRLDELDRQQLRFACTTCNADGEWTGEVVPVGDAAEVTVTWHVYLKRSTARSWQGRSASGSWHVKSRCRSLRWPGLSPQARRDRGGAKGDLAAHYSGVLGTH